MKIMREEIFGPVVAATPFDDPERHPRRRERHGLRSRRRRLDERRQQRAQDVAAGLRAGTVWVNCYNVFDPALPFGGFKQSGWGREMSHNALECYTETKSVVVKL
jgi:phenylacetaldehyde dehydrogenase